MGALRSYWNNKDVKSALHVPAEVTWQCADNDGPVATALAKDNMADRSELFATLLGKDYAGTRARRRFCPTSKKWGDTKIELADALTGPGPAESGEVSDVSPAMPGHRDGEDVARVALL